MSLKLAITGCIQGDIIKAEWQHKRSFTPATESGRATVANGQVSRKKDYSGPAAHCSICQSNNRSRKTAEPIRCAGTGCLYMLILILRGDAITSIGCLDSLFGSQLEMIARPPQVSRVNEP